MRFSGNSDFVKSILKPFKPVLEKAARFWKMLR